MKEIKINANDGGQRLDKFISKVTWGLPSSLMYKFIRTKRIKVNGGRAHEGDILALGDTVSFYIPDEFFRQRTDENEYSRASVKLNVRYEDENIIVCDKPSGVLSHTGDSDESNSGKIPERDTLLFAIKAYLCQKGEYDPSGEASFAPALCNRLDRNTGGLVIGAKNAAALREMNGLIKEGGVGKYYLAAVHGKLEPPSATLTAYLSKDSRRKTVTVTPNPTKFSKKIVTSYTRLKFNRESSLSLCEIKLGTGRTHQIRAHLAYIGHPLLGEGKYGNNEADRRIGWRNQALYSYKLVFGQTDGFFAYLSGKTVEADRGGIKFLTLFE